MYNYKFITKDSQPTFNEVENLITNNSTRQFFIKAKEHGFSDAEIKKLQGKNCGVCISKDDGFSDSQIKTLISQGGSLVTILANSFDLDQILSYLDKGASVLVTSEDNTFDPFDITKMIQKGTKRTIVVATGFSFDDIKGFLDKKCSLLLADEDVDVLKINDLVDIGKERINANSEFFTSYLMDKFLEGKCKLTIGQNCEWGVTAIENRVNKLSDKSQIHILSKFFSDEFVKKMEALGATIL